MNDPPATAAELVSRGAVLMTHRGRSPCTALHEAAHRGYLEIVKLLLEKGASSFCRSGGRGIVAGHEEGRQ
jgi:ankyrin repeat protein